MPGAAARDGTRSGGKGRNRSNGPGPTKPEVRSNELTPAQKEQINTVRAFGIEESKLADSQIISFLQSRANLRVEHLIEEFYAKGSIQEEFQTVTSKSDKKSRRQKGEGRSDRREERESRGDRNEKRAEPRPKAGEDRRNKPAPRPAQQPLQQAAPQQRAPAQPRGWSQPEPAQQSAWKEPAQQAVVPEPLAAPKPSGGMSWAQMAAPKAPPPKPAPVKAPPQPKHVSPPPSPQLESNVMVDKVVDSRDGPSSAAESDTSVAGRPAIPESQPEEPVSIGKPQAQYAVQTTGSVWGATAASKVKQDQAGISTNAVNAPAFEPNGQPAQPPFPPNAVMYAPPQPAASLDAGPSSSTSMYNPQQYGNSGLSGSGYMSSLGSIEPTSDATRSMEITFGGWGLSSANNAENAGSSTAGNGVKTYGSATSIPAPMPSVGLAKSEGLEIPSSSGMSAQDMTAQGYSQFMAGASFPESTENVYGSADGLQYAAAQHTAAQYAVVGAPEADGQARQNDHGRYSNKGNNKGGSNQASKQQVPHPHPQQAAQQQAAQQQPLQQQMQPQFYHQGQQGMFPMQGYPPYPQPYFGMTYQHPAGGQYQQPPMNMKRGQYQIPPQYGAGGFATPQAGYQYPQHTQAGQSSTGSFDYNSGYDTQSFAGQPDNSSDNAGSADKTEQQMPQNQAQMYNQMPGYNQYQAQMYYQQQMQQQQQPQYNQHMAYQQQQWQQQQPQQQGNTQ